MRLPRWRREQRERRRRKFVSFFRIILFLFVSFFLVLGSFFIFRTVKTSVLPKNSRQTLVLDSQPILVVSFEPGNFLSIISIPEKTYIEVTRGFGLYRFGAVWQLGGGELLAETVGEFLGVPVDGWIGPKMQDGKWKLKVGRENILKVKDKLTSWSILMRTKDLVTLNQSLQTNLTPFDLITVWWQIKTTRFDKIHFVDLSETDALSKLVLADGTEGLTTDKIKLDAATQGLFKDTHFINERISIEVLNGTDKPRLADRVSRLISNLGGEVISLGNSPQKVGNCQIRGEEGALKSFTAMRLGQIFDCQIISQKLQDSRADLQIIIGEDYWRKLYSSTKGTPSSITGSSPDSFSVGASSMDKR